MFRHRYHRCFAAARASALALVALIAISTAGCTGDDGDPGPQGPPGPPGASPVDPPTPTDDELTRDDDIPGIVVDVTEVEGGSGPAGQFQVGDTLSFIFSVKKSDGSDWDLAELGGRALVSGPTVNYQRVLAEKSDLSTLAEPLGGGLYRYTFATPIPATYLAPLNDSASFGPLDGEWKGQPLVSGTYTLGVYFDWAFSFEESSERDAGSDVFDFLVGTATTLQSREVVGQGNCNACHDDLQVHGSRRRDIRICVLCHTSGAEDKNVATAAGGTPGLTIDMRVMIHKIHNAMHLPSVLGVTTNPDGSRNYAATPVPYQIVGHNNSIEDLSGVAFPVWPNAAIPMPRDAGYLNPAPGLPSAARTLEDEMRRGVTACEKCHGDPDGAGGIVAPAQGDLAYSQPTRRACGSCHDDVVWEHLYTANGQTMPVQDDDSACILCHEATGTALDVVDAHLHPLYDPAVNPGLHVEDVAVAEGGTNDDDGTIDPGEKIQVTFDLVDDEGNAVVGSTLGSFNAVVSGPTSNPNLLSYESFPVAKLAGNPPYTTFLPERVHLEPVGVSDAGTVGEQFSSDRTPHWAISGATTTVWIRSAPVPAPTPTTVAAAAPAGQNWLDVASATGFARDQYIVIAEGTAAEEYRRIQTVQGNRLWFSSPYTAAYPAALQKSHAPGEAVLRVTLTAVPAASYTLVAATGTVTENVEFGGGAILMSYTTDFVVPEDFLLTLNDSPQLDESWGKWSNKAVASGTYTVTLWGVRSISLVRYGETNSYSGTSLGGTKDFLVGSATAIEPYALIESDESCLGCHQDIFFHGGGRRGYDTCIACHGLLGAEDRPPYVAANAPNNDVTVSFRTMLHKIHMGEDLANASTYQIAGFANAAYPNNYSLVSFEHVVFPVLPGGVKKCEKCHGEGNTAWQEPSERIHPTEPGAPVRSWRGACGSCHDSSAAMAHIDGQTSAAGAEACAVCHGPGDEWDVERMHRGF